MNLAKDYDVIIVGAGPAGCMTAINLHCKFKVLMIDRAVLPRDKGCAGMLKPEAFTLLKKYGLPEEVLSHPRSLTPRGIDLSSGRELVAPFRYYNADRRELDRWLLELARDNPKVEILGKAHLVNLREADGVVEVGIRRNGTETKLTCGFLVGADGASGAVGRAVCSIRPKTATCLLETVETAEEIDLTEFIGFIGRDIPYYHWVVPKADRIQVGAAFPPGETGYPQRYMLFKEVALGKLRLSELSSTPPKGWLITMLHSMSEICPGRGRILLAGEAAGLIDPSILEGITYALKSGELCAGAINADPSNPLPAYSSSLKPIYRKVFKQLLLFKVYRSKLLRLAAQRVIPQVKIARTRD